MVSSDVGSRVPENMKPEGQNPNFVIPEPDPTLKIGSIPTRRQFWLYFCTGNPKFQVNNLTFLMPNPNSIFTTQIHH